MNDLKIIDTSAENIHEFGMCGYKNTKHEGYQKKLGKRPVMFPFLLVPSA